MRILLLNQNHIGDALFSTPAIAALRKAHPDAFVVNAILPNPAPLFAANPHITENRLRLRGSAAERFQFLQRLRRDRFDAVITMAASSTRLGLLARLSGAPIRIGFDHPATRRFLTHAIPLRAAEQHHADDRLDQVRALGPVEGPFPLEIFPLPEWDDEWKAARKRLGLGSDQSLIGLNPGATVERKQWAPERWATLSDALRGEGFQPVLFGGPDDAALVERIHAQSRIPAPSAQGLLGLGGLSMACRDCAAFVSGDTGPLHVAVGMRTPVVALYGPTDPRRTGPYTPDGPRAVILRQPEPGPVGAKMSSITVEDVLEAVPRAVAMRLPARGGA